MTHTPQNYKTLETISKETGIPKRLLANSASKLDIDPSIAINTSNEQVLIELTRKIIANNTSYQHSKLAKQYRL